MPKILTLLENCMHEPLVARSVTNVKAWSLTALNRRVCLQRCCGGAENFAVCCYKPSMGELLVNVVPCSSYATTMCYTEPTDTLSLITFYLKLLSDKFFPLPSRLPSVTAETVRSSVLYYVCLSFNYLWF